MANPGIIALLVFLVICAAAIIGLILYVVLTGKRNKGTIVVPNCDETGYGSVPDITQLKCCAEASTIKPYTVKGHGTEINVLLAPFPVPYLEACSSFCQTYDPGSTRCLDDNPQYSLCIEASRPDNCRGKARPVATSGPYYYWISGKHGNNICTLLADCSI